MTTCHRSKQNDKHVVHLNNYLALEQSHAGGDHSHGHHGKEVCACAAKEADHPFSLDCKDKSAMANSWKTLRSCGKSKAGCKEFKDAKGQMPCKGAFFHLQFVHDWCPHDTLTKEMEKGIHDYEPHCEECEVKKPYNPKWQDCVKPQCKNATQATAAFKTLQNACPNPKKCCLSKAAQSAWTTVLSYHDLCDHDDVPTYIEKAYHDYEHACEDYGCNSVGAGYDGTKCPASQAKCSDVDTNDDKKINVEDLLKILAFYGNSC